MKGNPYLYILSMAAVSYLVRVLPLTLIRGEIRSRFSNRFCIMFHMSRFR